MAEKERLGSVRKIFDKEKRHLYEEKLWGKSFYLSAAGAGDSGLWRGWDTQCNDSRMGCSSDMDQVHIIMSAAHKMTKIILKKKAFTVSMADAGHAAQADYVGVASGYEIPDKFAKAGFHAVGSEFVEAPLIEELPLGLECELISYDEETGALVGKIGNASADERFLGETGTIDQNKL